MLGKSGASPYPVSMEQGEHEPANLRRRLVVIDVVTALLGWLIVEAVWVEVFEVGSRVDAGLFAVAMAAVTAVLANWQKLYLARVSSVRADEVTRLARVSVAALGVGYVMQRWLGTETSFVRVLCGSVLTLWMLVVARGQFAHWLQAARFKGRFMRSIVVVGGDEEAHRLTQLFLVHPEMGYTPVGYVGDEGDQELMGLTCLGTLADATRAAERVGASGIVMAATAMNSAEVNDIVRSAQMRNLHVHFSTGLAGFDYRRIRALPVAREPLFYIEPFSLTRGQEIAKRALDLVAATIVLLVSAPLFSAAAVAIKVSDRGPVLFRQVRVGRDGTSIVVYKLRTMVVDAEERLAELQTHNQRSGPLFKADGDDPRVTRVGRLLRASSLDELPQLFNVLQGTMSMVGPRPALPSEVAQFDDELLDRLQVKPGVTGLWQLEARDNPSFHAYRRLDLFYVENWSLLLDLTVLLGTARSVVQRGLHLALTRKDHRETLVSLPSWPGEPAGRMDKP